MTFPTIAGYNTSIEAAGTTSHTVSLPSGINVGDLLICIFSTDGDNTVTNWGGFTELFSYSRGTAIFNSIAYKIAVGSDTLTVVTSVSEPSSHCTYRITGHECDTIPPEASTVKTGTTDIPDSFDLTPSWIKDDTLWISLAGCDRRLFTDYPSNMSLENHTIHSGGNGGCGAAIAGANSNSTSFDPTNFTIAAADEWIVYTIAVPPDGATLPPPCQPQTNSRIANATETWQGACDVDIINWDKSDFILSTYATGGDGGNKAFKLQWKVSGGSFADVGAATTINYNASTSLVDGNSVGTPAGCLTSTVSEENEGDNFTGLIIMGASSVVEVQWALDMSGADDDTTYEFQLVNTTDTLTEVCSCSIRTQPVVANKAPDEKLINQKINRKINARIN